MTETPDKRKLNELRVVDLKHELEKRGKDGNGVKNVLLERLTQALRDEGQDPETVEFEIVAGKVAAKKGKMTSGGKTDEESNDKETTAVAEGKENDEPLDIPVVTIDDDEPVIKMEPVDIKEEPEDTAEQQPEPVEAEQKEDEQKDDLAESISTKEIKEEQHVNGGDEEVQPEEFAKPDDPVPAVPVEQAVGGSQKTAEIKDDSKEADNEDSLNLTIGEDDEKLLHDSNIEADCKEDETESGKEVTQNQANDSETAEEQGKSDKAVTTAGTIEKDDTTTTKTASTSSSSAGNDGSSATGASEKSTTTTTTTTSTGPTSTTTTAGSEKSTPAATPSTAADASGDGGGASSASNSSSNVGRNLWVSRLSTLTRATDLKQIFSKYGKVMGVKVVTNSRTPGTRCYGYVTMASAKDATECINHLHRTELHGRLISVERAKSELAPSRQSSATTTTSTTGTTDADGKTTASAAGNGSKAAAGKGDNKAKPSSDDKKKIDDATKPTSGERKSATKASEEKERKGGLQKDGKPRPSRASVERRRRTAGAEQSRSVSNIRRGSGDRGAKAVSEAAPAKRSTSRRSRSPHDRRSGTQRSTSQRREPRSRSQRSGGDRGERARSRDRDVLSLQKIREERERQRLRERERLLREEERRRREVRARQREEEERLEREREKLAAERERIEKEKAELLRIVRERQKLEREKIELEHLELKRQQRKYGCKFNFSLSSLFFSYLSLFLSYTQPNTSSTNSILCPLVACELGRNGFGLLSGSAYKNDLSHLNRVLDQRSLVCVVGLPERSRCFKY
uniref:Putative hsp27-ere-tata-binding protein/scaffold attachment factor saf-b n=1 Tax=Anopheles triannulatus TaxID=58253 RepID=A0A2M4A9H9_9DIPT